MSQREINKLFSSPATGLRKKDSDQIFRPFKTPRKRGVPNSKRDFEYKKMEGTKMKACCKCRCEVPEGPKQKLKKPDVIDLTNDDDDDWSDPKLDKFDLTKDDTGKIDFDNVFEIPVGTNEKDTIDYADTYFVF